MPVTQFFRSRVWWLAYLAPAVLVLAFILRFGVNAPKVDQWGLPDLFARVADGCCGIGDFWSPNNEHRVVLPKLLFVGLAFATKWDIRAELLANWGIATLGALCLIFLAGKTRRPDEPSGTFHLCLIGSLLAYFTLVQHQNLLWGFQFPFFAVQTFLLAGLCVVTRRQWNAWLRFLMAAGCCLLASFSTAQGLMTWGAMAACLWCLDERRGRRALFLFVWAALATGCALLYFHGLNQHSGRVEDPSYGRKHPAALMGAFFALAGGQFSRTLGEPHVSAALAAGGIACVAFGVLVAGNLWRGVRYREMAPWIAVGCFGGLVTAAIAYGRVEVRMESLCQTSKYVTGPPLIVVACLQLLRMGASTAGKSAVSKMPALAALAVIALVGVNSASAFRESREKSRDTAMAGALLPYLGQFDPVADAYRHGPFKPLVASLRPPFDGARQLRDKMPILEKLGFRKQIDDLHFDKSPNPSPGTMRVVGIPAKSAEIGPGKRFVLEGDMQVPAGDPVPSAVVITRDASSKLFLAAPLVDAGAKGKYHWKVVVSAELLPPGESSFSAWSFDASRATLRLLDGSGVRIRVGPGRADKAAKVRKEEKS